MGKPPVLVGYSQAPGGGDREDNVPIGNYRYEFPVPMFRENVKLVVSFRVFQDNWEEEMSEEGDWSRIHFSLVGSEDEHFTGMGSVGSVTEPGDAGYFFQVHGTDWNLYLESSVGGSDDGPSYLYMKYFLLPANQPVNLEDLPDFPEALPHEWHKVELPGHFHFYEGLKG